MQVPISLTPPLRCCMTVGCVTSLCLSFPVYNMRWLLGRGEDQQRASISRPRGPVPPTGAATPSPLQTGIYDCSQGGDCASLSL